jgi:transcriptional regulator with PAS, ATPase and Fis domain
MFLQAHDPVVRGLREATLAEKVAANERAMLEKALQENNNNRTATAKALGISRVGLYKKMKRHELIERVCEPARR